MVATGIVLAVLVIGTISATFLTLRNQPTKAPSSVTSGPGAVELSSPFQGARPIPVTRTICGTAITGFGTICTSTDYSAGIPQSFNMTGESREANQTAVTVFADYFAISVNRGDSVDFSMKATNATTFQGYFDTGANASSAASSVATAAGETLFNQSGNFQTYSGSARAPQSGAYAFAFSVPGPEFNDSVTFLLMDSAAYETGLTVNVGAPEPQDVTVKETLLGGLGAQSGFGWEIVPITVYSPETTSVNLTSFTLDSGGWLRILPAYLPDVGPEGANASIYMDGPEVTTNRFNSSLFVGASGADGLTGDAVIPIEVSSSVNVISGPGPVSPSAGGMACPPCMETVGLVYDPANGSSKSPMTVAFSIAGLLNQNGSVAPLPSWLDAGFPAQNIAFGSSTPSRTTTVGPGSVLVTPIGYETDDATYTPQSSNFSLVLQPFEPYYFVMTLDWQSVPRADQGFYTLVLHEAVDGQSFVGDLKIDAVPFPVQ